MPSASAGAASASLVPALRWRNRACSATRLAQSSQPRRCASTAARASDASPPLAKATTVSSSRQPGTVTSALQLSLPWGQKESVGALVHELVAHAPAARGDADEAVLEDRLLALWQSGRSAWPGVDVPANL